MMSLVAISFLSSGFRPFRGTCPPAMRLWPPAEPLLPMVRRRTLPALYERAVDLQEIISRLPLSPRHNDQLIPSRRSNRSANSGTIASDWILPR